MAQTSVQLISCTKGDNCITLLVGGRRTEYYFDDPGVFSFLSGYIRVWQESGWTNYMVARLTEKASEIRIPDFQRSLEQQHTTPPWAKEERSSIVSNYRKEPSEEYSWTIIATEAQGITYNGGRRWFASQEDAKAFAAEIFELEKNKRTSFDLAVVQCIDVVRPKPQVELISSFKKESSQGT